MTTPTPAEQDRAEVMKATKSMLVDQLYDAWAEIGRLENYQQDYTDHLNHFCIPDGYTQIPTADLNGYMEDTKRLIDTEEMAKRLLAVVEALANPRP